MNKEQKFQLAIVSGISLALSLIDQNFENTPKLENRLAYHTRPHTRSVISWTGILLNAMQEASPNLVTNRDISLGKLAAAWHDTIQLWQPDTADGKKIRKRAIGENEEQSANLAEIYMEAVNKQIGKVFSKRDIRVVKEAIMITVPGFDKKLETAVQPNFFKNNKNLIAQAVALADLGAGGLEGSLSARWIFDSLFVEDNLDFAEYMRSLQEQTSVRRFSSVRDIQKEEWYHNRMLISLKSQINFILGRQKQLEIDIASMDSGVQDAVREKFTKFEETITELQLFTRERKSQNFQDWINDLQTNLQNPPVYDLELNYP